MLRLIVPLFILAAAGCRPAAPDPESSEQPPVEVSVQTAVTGNRHDVEEVVGTVRARRRTALEAKVSGRIARLHVAPGQLVDEGDLLVELDAEETAARVEQARAVQQQAERELARVRSLLAQGAVTQAEFDSVEARHRVAVATVSETESLLGYATVNAPFAGVVTRKYADVGDMAGPGRPILELEDPDLLRFEADVPVTLLGRISLGDSLKVRIATVPEIADGVVGEVEPSADAASGTFRIRVDLPPGIGARAGLFGRVGIPMGESNVLTIPQQAVVVRGQLELVQVVVNDRAQLRLVRTGKVLGTDVEILAGLEEGEQVILEGAGAITEGQPVRAR